jgi:hypothetical protein
MSDVNITVMVDGKAAFVHGAAGAPDACVCAANGLAAGLAHFQAVKAATTPQTQTAPAASAQGSSL